MLLRMGFRERSRPRYERLNSSVDEAEGEAVPVARPRSRWVTKMNGRLKGLRLSRHRKLNWKAFSIVVYPRRIGDIVSRLKMDGSIPTIIFSCQWGLPVLSHSTVRSRNTNAMYLARKFT